MAESFTSVVEQATARKVRAFRPTPTSTSTCSSS